MSAARTLNFELVIIIIQNLCRVGVADDIFVNYILPQKRIRAPKYVGRRTDPYLKGNG